MGAAEQKPSVCRMVHFYPAAEDSVARNNNNDGPIAGIITRVAEDDLVNLTIFPDAGLPVDRIGVPKGTAVGTSGYWEWPPRV